MKYKILSVLAVIGVLAGAVALHFYEPPHNRYHQHLEARQYTPCTDHGDDVFCTHLPLMSITTDGPMPDPYYRDAEGNIRNLSNGTPDFCDEMVPATVKLYNAENANNHLTDSPVFEERAMTRIRGNSSRHFDKKNYLLKFKESNLVDARDISIDGMTADSSWVLHGPFMDRSLIRNYLCCNLVGEVTGYAPNVRFCEVFLNDEYMGLYLLMEKINYNKSGRILLDKTDPKAEKTPYLLQLDAARTDPLHRLNTFCDSSGRRGMSNRWWEQFEIIYPSRTLTPAQKHSIADEISSLEKALTSFDSADYHHGYHAFLDVDSFVDFWVLNEFMQNADAGIRSTYYYKDLRGKLKISSWDYNNTFNNYNTDLSDPHRFYIANVWYDYLMKDEEFVTRIIKRYRQLRKTYLSDEYLMSYIDGVVDYLGPAIERNNEKWGYCFQLDFASLSQTKQKEHGTLIPPSRNPRSYQEAIDSLKKNIAEHRDFLDQNIDALYDECHSSLNKDFKLQEGG